MTRRMKAAYVVYLCFVAVSANPMAHCNPTYSDKENVLALVMGLTITFLSISGTVYFSSKSTMGLVSSSSTARSAAATKNISGTSNGPATTADLEQVA